MEKYWVIHAHPQREGSDQFIPNKQQVVVDKSPGKLTVIYILPEG